MRYTYVRQHDTTDCAAACLAMVCLHYKKEITITRLRDMMGTDLKGTNLTGLQKAAEELGRAPAARPQGRGGTEKMRRRGKEVQVSGLRHHRRPGERTEEDLSR